ncbi:Phytanoyl-CoA dioxygenase [Balamuthia mandrillaris]
MDSHSNSSSHLLSTEQLGTYKKAGFLLVHDFFDVSADLEPVMQEIASAVDLVTEKLAAAGKIQEKHQDKDLHHRLTFIEQQFPGASVLVHTTTRMGPAMAKLWSHPKLLDVVEQALAIVEEKKGGSEENMIAGHPVWNLRAKTPRNSLATVPWHQDTAYLAAGSEGTLQVTAWIPLCHATKEMGTLHLLKSSSFSQSCYWWNNEGEKEKKVTVLPHHLEKGRKEKSSHSECEEKGDPRSWYLYIKEEDLPEDGEVVACEVPLGSFILFHNLIPHCSGDNVSDRIRWSVDLRWQRPSQPSGFEGIHELLLMRTGAAAKKGEEEERKEFMERWEEWRMTMRNKKQKEVTGMVKEAADEFDTNVSGPWLARWS